MADGTAVVTGVSSVAVSGTTNTYMTDANGNTTYGGRPLALVGDFVGIGGVIQLLSDPINAQITYRGIPLALTEALVTPHLGVTHPTITLPSELTEGSPDGLINNRYRLVRIGDQTACGDVVTMNPSLIPVETRLNELRERGSPAVPI